MKITVDEEKCCGAGQCVLIAPEVFDQRDEDGIVVLLDAEPGPLWGPGAFGPRRSFGTLTRTHALVSPAYGHAWSLPSGGPPPCGSVRRPSLQLREAALRAPHRTSSA